VFIDRRLLAIDMPHGGRVAVPGANDALAYLTDSGFDVRVVDAIPDIHPSRSTSWLLTSDRADCSEARRRGLRTVLVGPHSDALRPTQRCDEEARDLSAAALGLLASDAMARR
jgi:hypothetical protein